MLGSSAVSGGQERPWMVSLNLPIITLKLGMLAKQTFLPGQSSFGDPGCSEQCLGAKLPKALVLTFPARSPHAPGTAPVDTIFISIFLWMPLLGRGSGGARSADFAVQLQTSFFAEPMHLCNSNCDGIFDLML
eukprot:1151901-Pelagomonas_calceolata.AAC.3